MAGGKEEYDALFYSLVSTDTQISLFLLCVLHLALAPYGRTTGTENAD
jgi:hypothetical protein